MKRTIIALGLVVCVGYAAVSTACGTSGYAVSVGPDVDCPDGMEPHRASQQYHGWTFETGGGCECASGMCIDFSGDVTAYNRDEASWDRCPDFAAGIPNMRHSLCTSAGWATMWWDGTTDGWVCVSYRED